MIYLILVIIFIIILLIVLFIKASKLHKNLFNHRFEKHELVKYYTYDEFNLEEETFDIKCDNDNIKGFIYKSKEYDPNKIIIFTHGMYADHGAYMQDIAYIATKHLVVSFDMLGTSKSSGKSLKSFSNSTKSLDYVINYVKKRFKDKEIYLIGHSWGAYATLSCLKYHPDVKGIVAMSPFISRTNAIKDLFHTKYLTPFIYLIDSIKGGKYSKTNIIKNLENYQGKVLIISSRDDKVINFNKNTKYLMDRFPNFKYIIEDNKNHNPEYSKESVARLNVFLNDITKLSGEELTQYMKNTNYHSLGELDSKVMDEIVDFMKQ